MLPVNKFIWAYENVNRGSLGYSPDSPDF